MIVVEGTLQVVENPETIGGFLHERVTKGQRRARLCRGNMPSVEYIHTTGTARAPSVSSSADELTPAAPRTCNLLEAIRAKKRARS